MKILVVCQHYWPEPYFLPEVCERLAERGHSVHVVTDVPNYPMGRIFEGYRHGERREEERNGVRISRTFTVGRRTGKVFRLFNYYSYCLSSSLFVRRLPGDYDVVFANQTSPVMMTRAAAVYAKKWKKRSVMYCMDLWPASLAAGGVRQDSLLYAFFGAVSRRLYSLADRILITSRMFRDYLEEVHGIPEEKIGYLPQFAHDRETVGEMPEDKRTVDLLFAGNVGTAQSLDTVLRAAALLGTKAPDGRELRWHIVGEGVALASLKELAARLGLDNVRFHGRKPAEEMPRYYAMADALIVTLIADPDISRTLPGKVQSYMAAGKPILAAANGEIPQILAEARCGYCSEAEDSEAFAQTVRAFLADGDKAALGRRAREYFENNYRIDTFIDRLESELRYWASH